MLYDNRIKEKNVKSCFSDEKKKKFFLPKLQFCLLYFFNAQLKSIQVKGYITVHLSRAQWSIVQLVYVSFNAKFNISLKVFGVCT